MRAQQASMALAFVAALAVAGWPDPACGAQGRGRARSGDGRGGGSHAVPRGQAPGRSHGVAPRRSSHGSTIARHPRPGSGVRVYARSGRSGRGLSGFYLSWGPRSYGGYDRPYRRSYRGWLGSSWWPSLSFVYSASPYYDYGYDEPPSSVGYVIDESPGAPTPYDEAGDDDGSADDVRSQADTGRLRLVTTPSDAAIYVDDDYWGEGGDTRPLTLRSGAHTVEVVRPGFLPVRRDFVVVRGQTSELRVELPRP